MENEKTLETRAVISDMADFVQDLVNQLLANSVVTAGVVVGCVLLAGDHLLRVEQAAVGASADLINDVGLEIAVDGSGDIFALTCIAISRQWGSRPCMRIDLLTGLGKEGAEALIRFGCLALFGQVSIWLSE